LVMVTSLPCTRKWSLASFFRNLRSGAGSCNTAAKGWYEFMHLYIYIYIYGRVRETLLREMGS